jgi:enterochelin esterase-like enzyme
MNCQTSFKTRISILFSLLFFSFSLFSQTPCNGKVMESLSFHSKILNKDVKYSIYLPPDYETSQRSYPALYLLHGFSDDETGWIQFGEANIIADQAIKNNTAPPMIIIMPDGGVTWYANDYKGKENWSDMFIQELIPYMESTYRIRQKKEFRAISGLSMGGYGSLHIAMRYPEMFSSCVAFSSGTFTDEEIVKLDDKSYKNYFGFLFGDGLKGEDRLSANWKRFSPLDILDTQDPGKLKKVKWYIDCGDDDFLYRGNSHLHLKMREIGIPHEYRVRDGVHSWVYWRSGLPEALKFIGKSFHR